MSDQVLTKEQEVSKFIELKERGYENLKGDDRKMYKELKKKYPELAASLKQENESDNSSNKDEIQSADHSNSADSEVVEVVYKMTRNVLHNGNKYPKDSLVSKDDSALKHFLDKGYAIKVLKN